MERLPSMSDTEILRLSYDKPSYFKEFFDRHSGHFISVAKRYGLSQDTAEDIAQEVFIKIYKAGKNFLERPEENIEADFKPWVNTILRNTVIDALRKNKKETPLTEEMESVLKYEVDERAEAESADYFTSILNKIDNAEAEILKLRFVFGKSFKEIGKVLGITSSTARVRLHRAKKDFLNMHKKLNEQINLYGK